ncbi:MAG: cytochrome c [Bryobacteraceae bacterium]
MSANSLGLVRFALFLGAVSVVLTGQTTVKKGPPPVTSPASGQEMYKAYCAACHGVDGKGNGPAAESLKTAPTDLTQLTVKNNGKFPNAEVYTAIKGDPNMPTAAHGSTTMPVWGTVFSSMNQHSDTVVHLRIANLVHYIESMQVK